MLVLAIDIGRPRQRAADPGKLELGYDRFGDNDGGNLAGLKNQLRIGAARGGNFHVAIIEPVGSQYFQSRLMRAAAERAGGDCLTFQVADRFDVGPADEHEKNLLLDRRADDFDLQSPRYADQNRCAETTHLGLSAGRRSERFGSAFFKWDELKIDAVFLEDTLLHTKNDVQSLASRPVETKRILVSGEDVGIPFWGSPPVPSFGWLTNHTSDNASDKNNKLSLFMILLSLVFE